MGAINPAGAAGVAKAERESWWDRGMQDVLFRLLDPIVTGRSIRTAVDAGWGTGYLARILQARYDWLVFSLAIGWEGQGGVERMAQADLSSLPFPDGSFDAVFSIDVLGSVPQGEEVQPLRELTRVLAPKGLLVLRVAALDIFRHRHSVYLDERQRYTRERLVELVEPCGIRVLRVSYVNALLAPVALAKFRIWDRLMRTPPSNGLPAGWLDRLLHLPLALEAYWLGAGLNLPLGRTLLLVGEKSG
jgi:SAM-dependent methyltransferase